MSTSVHVQNYNSVICIRIYNNIFVCSVKLFGLVNKAYTKHDIFSFMTYTWGTCYWAVLFKCVCSPKVLSQRVTEEQLLEQSFQSSILTLSMVAQHSGKCTTPYRQ